MRVIGNAALFCLFWAAESRANLSKLIQFELQSAPQA